MTQKTIGEWTWNTEVLWKKIVQTGDNDCWAWIGSRGPQTNLFGVRKSGKPQMTQARRILYRDVYNEDCDDLQIKHTCGDPYCMNWHHFDVRPNHRRFYSDGTLRGTRVKQDETQGLRQAKLVKVREEKWWQR